MRLARRRFTKKERRKAQQEEEEGERTAQQKAARLCRTQERTCSSCLFCRVFGFFLSSSLLVVISPCMSLAGAPVRFYLGSVRRPALSRGGRKLDRGLVDEGPINFR